MNNLKQETIADIVAEIRRLNPETFMVSPWCYQLQPNKMRSYADRIETAYNREREAGIEVARRDIDNVMRIYGRLVKKLRSENKRLLSALKPVLDAYISQDDPSVDVYDSRLDAAVCVRAVRDAKRIYEEVKNCSGTVPTKDLYLVVREAQAIYNGGAK